MGDLRRGRVYVRKGRKCQRVKDDCARKTMLFGKTTFNSKNADWFLAIECNNSKVKIRRWIFTCRDVALLFAKRRVEICEEEASVPGLKGHHSTRSLRGTASIRGAGRALCGQGQSGWLWSAPGARGQPYGGCGSQGDRGPRGQQKVADGMVDRTDEKRTGKKFEPWEPRRAKVVRKAVDKVCAEPPQASLIGCINVRLTSLFDVLCDVLCDVFWAAGASNGRTSLEELSGDEPTSAGVVCFLACVLFAEAKR